MPGAAHHSGRAAEPAETMAQVPEGQGAGMGEKRSFLMRQEHAHGPQVREAASACEARFMIRILQPAKIKGKAGTALVQAEKDGLAAKASQDFELVDGQGDRARFAAPEIAEKRAVLPERIDPRVRLSQTLGQPVAVVSKVVGTVQARPAVRIRSLLH